MELHERLQNARKRAGFLQKQVADRLGVNHSAVSHWESGRRIPDLDTVVRIADLTGTDRVELLGVEPSPKPNAGFASFADLASSANQGNLREPFTREPAPAPISERWETLKAVGILTFATIVVVALLAVGRFVHWPQ